MTTTTTTTTTEQQRNHIDTALGTPVAVDAKDITEATNATIAQRVATGYGDRLCYVRSTDKAHAIDRAAGWLHYKRNDQGGGVWTREGAEKAVVEAIDQTIRDMLKEAGNDPDTSKVQQRTRDLLNALNRTPAIKQVATYYLDRPLSDFNRDPSLLNVKNGTLDLLALDPKHKAAHPMLVREASAEDRCSKQAQACYVLGAKAPRWESFLEEVFGGDREVIDYVQRALGYSLLGANPEHAAFICYGSGGNGKSTLLDTMTDLLGGYAGILSPDVLVSDYVRSGSSLQPELTAHRDTRLIVSSEPKKGVLNSHRIKSWTGDSHIQLRMMYGEPETIPITFDLWLMTNVLPDINELTLAVERRMHLIPFTESFVGCEDRDLKTKLWQERDGILLWLLEGLAQYFKARGLHPPERILQAARDWYQSESLYTKLFDEVLTRGTRQDRVLLSDLKEALAHYIDEHAEDFPRVIVNTTLVKGFLKEFGLTSDTVGGDVYVYGVKLGTDEWHLDVDEDRQSDLTVKQKLYLALCEDPLLPAMRAVDLAEATELNQKSVYVILKRMVDEDLLVKDGSWYKIARRPLVLDPPDDRTQFIGQLAWRAVQEYVEQQGGDTVPISPSLLADRVGLATGFSGWESPDAIGLLHLMAKAPGQTLTATTDWDNEKHANVSHFTYHRHRDAAAA